ncbi:MAG: DUF2723 domain-containing protein [Phycisphaerae bacterium]|nr:DUF2723 domain-containing protein [Phycisphaerae bacterium]
MLVTSAEAPPPEHTDGPDESRSGARDRSWPVAVGLGAVIAAVYLLTMHPGIGRGDSAALQYASAVGGLCYPPGYMTEVLAGKLFCMLPVGPDPAWRVNLMSVVFGVAACLVFYATVRRITGVMWASVAATLTLVFSSIFWGMAVIAEVYVFYGAFLILGIYCCVRFVQGGRKAWLYLMALALGFSIGGRPCELAVLPAFLPVWAFYRRRVRLRPADAAVCLVLFVLPFCVSVGGVLVQYAHPSSPAMREDVLSEEIRLEALGLPAKQASQRGLRDAVVYSLGLLWADRRLQADVVADDAWQYTRMLLGLTAWDRPSDISGLRLLERETGIGVSMGILGIGLAVWGTLAARGRYGWVLLGWGMFLGNLCYYVYNHRIDSRTFVIPGLIGLGLLVGLGAGAVPWGRLSARARRAWPVACLAVPLILLVANWAKVDRNGKDDWWWVSAMHRLAEGPVPQDTAFVMTSWPGNACRYAMHVLVDRPDVTVVNAEKEWMNYAAGHFADLRRPIAVPALHLSSPEQAERLLQRSPPAMADLALVLLLPPPATVTAP